MPKGEVKVRESQDEGLIARRFWSRVEISYRDRGPLGLCWEWQGVRDKDGYGQFRYKTRQSKAHRITLILLGIDPGSRQVAHHCDNPSCVRPLHLFVATPAENTQDMMAKGRHNYVSNLPRVLAARARKGVN